MIEILKHCICQCSSIKFILKKSSLSLIYAPRFHLVGDWISCVKFKFKFKFKWSFEVKFFTLTC